jgi:hypothetical protein
VSRDTERVWKVLAATSLVLAGLTCLTYAGWVVTARRALFADIAEAAGGGETVSMAAARGSDAMAAGWSAAATLLMAVAVVLWAAARFLGGHRFGPVGVAGLSLVAIGVPAIATGAIVAATGGSDPTEAGRAAIGCSVVGAGFLLTALGLLTGAMTLLRGPHATYLGYAGWSAG